MKGKKPSPKMKESMEKHSKKHKGEMAEMKKQMMSKKDHKRGM